jgi:sugar/nucleoside kinase (ribokinase family)
MSGIWTMGEMLVEIMRPRVDMEHDKIGEYMGPYPSGAPAIFIDTVARLGMPAGIIGGVGEDQFGRLILDRLENDGVDCSHVIQSSSGSTATAFVMYRNDGTRNFIFHINDTPAVKVWAPVVIPTTRPSFFHVMGCSLTVNEQFCQEIIRTMELFLAAGARISFDPNIRPELLTGKSLQSVIAPVLENCSVLLPGVDELLLISGQNDIESAVTSLFKNPKLEIIALKMGKKGSSIFTRMERFNFGVYDVIPIDPTGAGDCFDGAFLAGLVQGKSIADCTKMATAAASLNTAARGPMEGNITLNNVLNMMVKNRIV